MTLADLIEHRQRIAACVTFEEFQYAQLVYMDLLIAQIVKRDEELIQTARDVLAELDQ